ncbi:MAG TPA: TonB-dependent receptor [Novosphingobium sp.]|nr:TonB-dependent receptor [Novosphingobium sp.]
MTRTFRTYILVATGLIAPELAHAQRAPAASASAEAADIVVTAQRREERLVDVPMSVTAISSETLVKSGVSNTSDLARVTPGLTITSYSNNLQPSIRGVTATGGNTGDNPSVGVYLDGVYQSQQVAALMDLPDVQQIEVLKGPQGTLYGENSTGGAIVIRTVDPSTTDFTGKLSASYGNLNAVDLRGFVSAPIVQDKVAVSVAGAYQDRKGYLHNVVTGERDMGLKSKLVRGKVLLEPSDGVKLVMTAYYSDRNDSATFAASPLNDNSVGYALIPTAPRVTKSSQYGTDPGVFSRIRASGVSAVGDIDMGVGGLTLMAAYAKTKVTAFNDLDASAVTFAEYHWEPLRTKTFVSEATFTSQQFGAFSFIAGAFYLDGSDNFDYGRYVQYDPVVYPANPGPTAFQLLGFGLIKRTIASVYGELTVEVSDKLTLTAGGRYSHERQTGFAGTNPAFGGAYPTPPIVCPYNPGGVPCNGNDGNPENWSNFSPRATARYEIAPNQNIYASYTAGFKGGLINTSDMAQKAVDPETIKAYEIGYKGQPIPGLLLGLAAYLYDYKNLVVSKYVDASTYSSQNAASARGKGVEFTADWAVTPNFRLSGGISYLDAKYRDFENAQSYAPAASGYGNDTIVIPNRRGDRLIRAPKWSGNVMADYSQVIPAGEIGANASLFFTTSYGVDPLGLVWQSGFATVGGELSFAPSAISGLRLVAWGKNLTDKRYFSGGQANALGTQISWAEPRTIGVRAEYRF